VKSGKRGGKGFSLGRSGEEVIRVLQLFKWSSTYQKIYFHDICHNCLHAIGKLHGDREGFHGQEGEGETDREGKRKRERLLGKGRGEGIV
jgi:hypothetical protein